VLVGRLDPVEQRAFGSVGPELLLRAALILADDVVRRIQDVPRRAVVLLQGDDLRVLVVFLEGEYQPDICPTPTIN
jgi:hypothetical protein